MSNWNRRKFLAAGASCVVLGQGSGGFQFALIGDRTGNADPEIFRQTWQQVHQFRPALTVSIGDIIQGGDDRTAVRQWREMDAIWRDYRRYTSLYVPGNHDIWSQESKRLFEIEAGHPVMHTHVHRGALFVILDNSLTDDLLPPQLEYCESQFAKHKELKPKFVFCHRPSWLLNVMLGNRNFPLHDLARKHAVDYVISGHVHQLLHLQLDGVHYLQIGSSGGSMERGLKLGQGFKEGWFYHWISANVQNGKVEMTVREVAENGRVFSLADWDSTPTSSRPALGALARRPG
ncbi:MAG: metallophosphoesterase [Acidobacteria bacterium]|nr:metallophosphoesterase [Acidobacteriota bacterium]